MGARPGDRIAAEWIRLRPTRPGSPRGSPVSFASLLQPWLERSRARQSSPASFSVRQHGRTRDRLVTGARPGAFEAGSPPTASTVPSSIQPAAASSVGRPRTRHFVSNTSIEAFPGASRSAHVLGAAAASPLPDVTIRRGWRSRATDPRHERSHEPCRESSSGRPRLCAHLDSCQRRVHARTAGPACAWSACRTDRTDARRRPYRAGAQALVRYGRPQLWEAWRHSRLPCADLPCRSQ